MQSAPQHLKHCLGFTYIGLMLIVAIAGIALSGVGIVWKTEMQRENEKELRFAGEQYVAAIASYYECKVCGPQQLPKNLKDLLKDSRAPSVVRHLRKLYRDPMTRSNDWGLIKNGDRITGVYSKSKLEPLAKPYDSDLLKKKKNATQLGNATSVNQANINQTGVSNSNNSVVGSNIPSINKSDTNNPNQSVKPKKPSYQDWQFVYGGAAKEVANTAPKAISNNTSTSNTASSSNTNNSQTPTNIEPDPEPEDEVPQEDPGLICDEEFTKAGEACNKACQGGAGPASCNACFRDAKEVHEECRRSLSQR